MYGAMNPVTGPQGLTTPTPTPIRPEMPSRSRYGPAGPKPADFGIAAPVTDPFKSIQENIVNQFRDTNIQYPSGQQETGLGDYNRTKFGGQSQEDYTNRYMDIVRPAMERARQQAASIASNQAEAAREYSQPTRDYGGGGGSPSYSYVPAYSPPGSTPTGLPETMPASYHIPTRSDYAKRAAAKLSIPCWI